MKMDCIQPQTNGCVTRIFSVLLKIGSRLCFPRYEGLQASVADAGKLQVQLDPHMLAHAGGTGTSDIPGRDAISEHWR